MKKLEALAASRGQTNSQVIRKAITNELLRGRKEIEDYYEIQKIKKQLDKEAKATQDHLKNL